MNSPFLPFPLSPLLAAFSADPYILTFSFVTVAITVWMGFRSAKTSKTASDFFVAGRSVGVGMNASAISGEYLSAASFMGIAGMVMSSGYDALWYPVCYACGYLFLLLFIAGPLRRFGAYTIPDFAEGRFDSPLFRKIAVVFVLFIGFFYTMPQMKGAGTTLAYIFPGLPYWAGVVLVGAVITLNVALGGMKGITLVQAFQYWAKMFAISVPIFVLMAVYGHYGKQLGVNGQTPVASAGWTSYGKTNLLFDGTDTTRQPLPAKAPADATWLNPFGPLTTKAAKAAAAAGPQWNLTPELRASLVDIGNAHPPGALDRIGGAVERIFESPANNAGANPTRSSQFSDWTNTPPNSRRFLPAGFPMLSMLNEYGLLDGRSVLVATNLPTEKVFPDGSFQSRDQFLSYLQSMFLTNGVRLDLSGDTIKAVAVADWERYSKDPKSVALVPNRATAIPLHSESRFLIDQYGELVSKKAYMATNLSPGGAEPTPRFSPTMQPEQLAPLIAKTLAERGITLIPAGPKEVWAVPTSDLARYQRRSGKEQFTYAGETIAFTNSRSSAGFGKWLKRQFVRSSTAVGGGETAVTNLVKLYASKTLAAEAFAPDTYVLRFSPSTVAQQILVKDFAFSSDAKIAEAVQKELAAQGISVVRDGNTFTAARTTELTLKPLDPKPYALLYTYSLIIAIVCGTAGLPHILVRFYTNPDGVAAKRTTMWVMILIGVFYVFPPVFGVIGRNLLPDLYNGLGAKGTDKIVLELPRLLNEKYPPLGSILSGITCAGAFAAFMSTFSGLLVSMTGALAHDVYGRILRPKSTPEQRMRMFKLGAVLIGGVAIVLGSFVEPLEINFMVGQAFAIAAASYFPLLFMAVWWRKLTMKGAAIGMLVGGVCALVAAALTNFSNLALDKGPMGKIFSGFAPLNNFWAEHPLLRILCEQPAIWAVPLAIVLMIVVSKLTAATVPSDSRMKMLVLHAPEQLGLKQEYIQEHQGPPGH
jgi:Na+(H+)/acetate symporter ActP